LLRGRGGKGASSRGRATPARHPEGAGRAAEPASAYQQALGLLVRREHSQAELGRKLRARGVDDEAAGEALLTLARQDFQNDERFAQAWARTRAGAGYGPVRIRAELGMHALARDTIAAALDACETDWGALALGLVQRRYRAGALADPAQRRKAHDWLLRRGFDSRCIAQALGRSSQGEGPDD
jgi:regulatory protein